MVNEKLQLNLDGAGTINPIEKLSLVGQTNGYSLPHQEDLADKYDVGMGPVSPGRDTILSAIRSGTENRMAELLASQQMLEAQKLKNDIVQQIADTGMPTAFDSEIVRALSTEELVSPDIGTILEEAYANRMVDLTTTLLEENDGIYSEAANTNLDATDEVITRTQRQAARNMVAVNILDKLNEKFGNSGLLTQGWAYAQQLVPFRDWASTAGAIPSAPARSLFSGDTLEDVYSYMRTLSPSELKVALEDYVKREEETGNYVQAMNFVQGFLSYSDLDKNMDNLFNVIDVAEFAPVGLLAKGLKGASRSVMAPVKDLERIASVADLPVEATRAVFNDSITKGVLPSRNINILADIERTVPSLMRPQEEFNGRVLRAGGPATMRLEQAAIARAGTAMNILTDVNRIERNNLAAIEKGYEEAVDFVKDNFVLPSHKIIDIKRIGAEDSPANIYSVNVLIGRQDGTTYASEVAALKAAKGISLRTNDYKVIENPNGIGWVIAVSRNVDESTDGVRALRIDTDSKLPDGWVTRLLSGAVGADNLLSKSQTMARGVAVQSSEEMGRLLEDFTAPFQKMSKNQRKEFEEFIIFDRDRVDPKQGQYPLHLDVFGFEDAFYQKFNKLPTYDQIDAYNSYRQLAELDRVTLELSVYRQKAIMGIEKFSFRLKGEGDEVLNFSTEGKEVTDFPRGIPESYRFAIVDDAGVIEQGNRTTPRYMNQKDWDRVEELKKQGYKIIQFYEGSKKIGGKYYQYIMVRNLKRDRPTLDTLDPRASRVVSRDPYYLKQPVVSIGSGRAYHHRDTAIASFRTNAEAIEAEKIMNTARLMVKNRTPGLQKFWNDNVPFWSLKDFLKQVKKGNLSLDMPIKVTARGARTSDSVQLLDDFRKEGLPVNHLETNDRFNLSHQVQGRFLGDDTAQSMDVYGVEKGTIFKLDRSPVLSPLDTMRHTMSNMVDAHIIHDYRIKNVRDFVANYGDILDGTKHDFDANPLEFIFNPVYKQGLTGENLNRMKSAEGQRKAMLSLFNHKTHVERQIDMYKEKWVRSIRSFAGDNVADFIGDTALPKAANADKAMRAFAFHSKLGLFNIKQLLLQSMSSINVLALSPVHGSRGAMATWPLMLAMNTKRGFIRDIGKKLQGVTTFSPDEYEELADLYRRSGFYNVGGDVAYLDMMEPPKVIKSGISTVLDWGRTPFQMGERIVRTMAFAAAYGERKALRKGTKLNRADEAWILQRAKDMTGNMTRDSNAAYQRGWGAIATQFFGYQMRLMEQMLGKKLTLGEKTRLFAGMSAMYGVPVAAGMTFGVWPIRDHLKDEMAKAGMNVDDTALEPFLDGFAATFLEQVFGSDLNVSEKYGPGGLPTFYDLLKGDADFSEALMGASGGILTDTVKDAFGPMRMIWETIDLNDQTTFPITAQELLEPFRNISTVNNLVKYWEATHTGMWISQNENALTKVSGDEAFLAYITGLDPERVSDAFNQLEALGARKEMQNEAMKRMTTDYKRALQLTADGFVKEAETMFKRVRLDGVKAGLSPKQMVQVYLRATDERPLDETVFENYKKIIPSKGN